MTTDVIQKEKFMARLGELYVTDIYDNINRVNFGIEREKAKDSLNNKEVQWLIRNIPNIKIIKVTITVEEHEENFTGLIF